MGPSKLVTVPGVEEDENGADVPSGSDITLMLVDFNASVLPLIREYDPAQDQHEIQPFLEDSPHVVPSSSPLLQEALNWMSEEVSGRVQFYSAEENVPAPVAAPLPPKKAEPKKKVTNAVLADQLSELSKVLPTIMQELQGLKERQDVIEGPTAAPAMPYAALPTALPSHKQPFPTVAQPSTIQDFSKKIGAAPKTKMTPVPTIRLDAQDGLPFNDDPNLPAADLRDAFDAAAGPPSMTQAIFQQSQAMNALVAHFIGNQDPLTDLASSSSTSLSTKGAGRREKTTTAAGKQEWGLFPSGMSSSPSPHQAVGSSAGVPEGSSSQSNLLEVHGEARWNGRPEGLCPGDVVVVPDRRCNGSPRSQRSSGVASSDASIRRTGGNGRRQMGSCVSHVASAGSPPIYLHLSDFIDQPEVEIVRTAVPPALGHHSIGFREGAGCDCYQSLDKLWLPSGTSRRRAEASGAKKGGGPSQEAPEGTENQPRRTRFPKKPKKGGDKEAA